MRTARGFTLWELLVAVAVAGTLAGMGVPALRWLLLDLRLASDVNGFVSAIQAARSESAKRQVVIVMCNSSDHYACSGPGETARDWIVFANDDGDRPPVRDADERLLHVYRPQPDGILQANRRYFEFRPFLSRSTNGTVTFCDSRGTPAARAVIVSYTGRPRTVGVRNGASLTCPDA